MRDLHEWEDGACDFHPTKQCTCKKRDGDAEPECEVSPYQTKHQLKCEYHWLAYVLECEKRAEEADSVIHPIMGRGDSNLCEAGFTVLPHFRSKTQSLCRYEFFLLMLPRNKLTQYLIKLFIIVLENIMQSDAFLYCVCFISMLFSCNIVIQ